MLQVEIALRQTAVFEAEYEPAFKVEVDTAVIAIGGKTDAHQNISLRNVGSYPAHNVLVGLVDGMTKKHIERLEKHDPQTLGPNESMRIFSMSEPDYTNMNIEMNVLYINVLNETRDARFVKFPKSRDFMILRYPPRTRPGILLKSLEDLKLAYTAVKWSRTMKKLQES